MIQLINNCKQKIFANFSIKKEKNITFLSILTFEHQSAIILLDFSIVKYVSRKIIKFSCFITVYHITAGVRDQT